jgi:hypothetical protein
MREPYPQEYGGGFKYKFDFIGASKKFTALVHGHSLHKTVSFSLADNWIEIQPDNSPMFKATVGLNDEGECVLDVDGEQRYPWQVRKMALEDLFFGVE